MFIGTQRVKLLMCFAVSVLHAALTVLVVASSAALIENSFSPLPQKQHLKQATLLLQKKPCSCILGGSHLFRCDSHSYNQEDDTAHTIQPKNTIVQDRSQITKRLQKEICIKSSFSKCNFYCRKSEENPHINMTARVRQNLKVHK